jgi:kynurenine formamidase
MQFFHLLFLLFNIKSIFSLVSFDLTYTIKSTNPTFPGSVFNFTQQFTSWKQDGSHEDYFVAFNTLTTSEHFGTHIDAPYHLSYTSWTIEQIPFERLVSIQALIVDVSKQSSKTKNYQIQIEDLNEQVIKQATGFFVLLFYTGRSKFWPDQKAYAGGSTIAELEFPGLSAQLASYLVEKYSKNLVGVGIDTLSSR